MRTMLIGEYEVEVCSFDRFCGYVYNNTMKELDYLNQFTPTPDLSKVPVRPFLHAKDCIFIEDYREYVLNYLNKIAAEEIANIIIVRVHPRKWVITNYKHWDFAVYKDYFAQDYASLTCKTDYKIIFVEKQKPQLDFTFNLASYTPKSHEYHIDEQEHSMFDFYSHYVYNKP
jgi:hypothetical protein